MPQNATECRHFFLFLFPFSFFFNKDELGAKKSCSQTRRNCCNTPKRLRCITLHPLSFSCHALSLLFSSSSSTTSSSCLFLSQSLSFSFCNRVAYCGGSVHAVCMYELYKTPSADCILHACHASSPRHYVPLSSTMNTTTNDHSHRRKEQERSQTGSCSTPQGQRNCTNRDSGTKPAYHRHKGRVCCRIVLPICFLGEEAMPQSTRFRDILVLWLNTTLLCVFPFIVTYMKYKTL